MAQRANITLTDAATTPVNRVYQVVANLAGNILQWINRTTTSVLAGQDRLTMFSRLADKTIPATKYSWKLEMPILAQASGGTSSGYIAEPKVSHTLIGAIEFVLPAKSVLQERKDLLAQVRDLINEQIMTDTVHDYNAPF